MDTTTTRDQAEATLPSRSQRLEALLDYEGAAPYLNCSPRMVRKLVELRQLDSVKVGRLVRIERAAIERYIEANRRPTASGANGDALTVHRAAVELIESTKGARTLDDVARLRGAPWGPLIVAVTGIPVDRVKVVTGGEGFKGAA